MPKVLIIDVCILIKARQVDFLFSGDTQCSVAKDALGVFVAQVGKLDQTAFDLQAYPSNRLVFNAARDRVTQAIVGELEVDEAIMRVQEDIDTGLEADSQ